MVMIPRETGFGFWPMGVLDLLGDMESGEERIRRGMCNV